jgi:acetyltransferase
VGRINRLHGTNEAEIAVLVADNFQKRGVGEELLRRTIRVAREEGIHALSAEMMADNMAMQVITKRLGFRVKMLPGFASLRARLEL